MIGLYFFFLIALWIGLVFLVSVVITKRLPASKWRPLVGIVLFTLLLPMVFIDELIGKWQFERLCQENSTIYIAPDAKGRTVYLASGTPEESVKGTWGVPIWIRQWRHVDTTTGETIVSYNSLRARGGWFMHCFFSAGPIIFQENYRPANLNAEMFKKIGVNCCVDSPKQKQGESK
jgi:hypothetical protein